MAEDRGFILHPSSFMLAVFSLRLASGMLGCLLLLSPSQVNPRFFRTHFLTALGLTALAAVFLRDIADFWLWLTLIGVLVLAALGSMAWMLEGAPGGQAWTLAALSLALLALAQAGYCVRDQGEPWWLLL